MLREHKIVVRYFLDDVWNQGKMYRIDDLFSPACVFVTPMLPEPVKGRENLKDWIESLRETIADLRMFPAGHMIAEGEQVALRWRLTGRQVGIVFEASPARKPLQVDGLAVYRLEQNQICEGWMSHDVSVLARQIRMMNDLRSLAAV